MGHVLAANMDISRCRHFQPSNQPQGRGLTATAWPKQRHKFSSFDGQIETFKGRDVTEFLYNAVKAYGAGG